jgi:hypothetical protein
MGVALVAALGCGGKPATVVPASLEVDWQPFRWAEVEIGANLVRRASILVETSDPVLLLERQHRDSSVVQMQLDFGFAGIGSFGIPLRAFEPTVTDPERAKRVAAGRIGRLGNRDDSTGVTSAHRLGTLGLLFFTIKGLLIDQAAQRLGAPRAGTTLPAALTDRMSWSDGREVDARWLMPLVWRGDRLGEMWYDPGSSLVPLLVSAPVWRVLTGRTGGESENWRLVFPVPGDSLVLVGAPTAAPLTLGTIPLGIVSVYHVAAGRPGSRPDQFAADVVGVIGNQLFERYRLLYFNVRGKRFGVIR